LLVERPLERGLDGVFGSRLRAERVNVGSSVNESLAFGGRGRMVRMRD